MLASEDTHYYITFIMPGEGGFYRLIKHDIKPGDSIARAARGTRQLLADAHRIGHQPALIAWGCFELTKKNGYVLVCSSPNWEKRCADLLPDETFGEIRSFILLNRGVSKV